MTRDQARLQAMDPYTRFQLRQTRRHFLSNSGRSLGAAALALLLGGRQLAGTDGKDASRGVLHPLHFAPKAKRVIWLYMAGGPSHLESFDYKPELARNAGKAMPASLTEGQPIAQLQDSELRAKGPQFSFARHGQSQQEISELFPHIAKVADDICIVRSMRAEQINHDPAHTFMNTGTSISGRPSMGAWLTYGLGNEAEDLPGFVVLTSVGGGQDQPIAARQWHSGFLPSRYQGVRFNSKGDPVHYLSRPSGITESRQRDTVEAVERMNRERAKMVDDPEIATRIRQYELAFKMQTSVPELVDFSDEPAHIRELYGASRVDGTFAANCLLARRMAERGVRFMQLYHRGWDHHSNLEKGMKIASGHVDRGAGALVTDLKQRGMLDDTLVIWGGEFGRTPMAQGDGRDHHIAGFSIWMAGGGIKGGVTHGATDDFGYHAAENIVTVHDLHATMLYLLGIDHKKFTYRFQGRDFRLTDVHGEVVKPILA